VSFLPRVPAKARIHLSIRSNAAGWAPAFAGTPVRWLREVNQVALPELADYVRPE